MPRLRHRTDAQIFLVLREAPSCNEAARLLGYDRPALRARCSSGILKIVYDECRVHGHKEATVVPGQTPKTCALCRQPNHNRQNCPTREEGEGGPCRTCYGLSHRRPRGIRVLCACGEPWAPEPEVTLTEIFERPNVNRRELI